MHAMNGYVSRECENMREHEPAHQGWVFLPVLEVNMDSSSHWYKFVSRYMHGNSCSWYRHA